MGVLFQAACIRRAVLTSNACGMFVTCLRWMLTSVDQLAKTLKGIQPSHVS